MLSVDTCRVIAAKRQKMQVIGCILLSMLNLSGSILVHARWMPFMLFGLLFASIPSATFLLTLITTVFLRRELSATLKTWLTWCMLLSTVVALGELIVVASY
jgi:hypothetical protein